MRLLFIPRLGSGVGCPYPETLSAGAFLSAKGGVDGFGLRQRLSLPIHYSGPTPKVKQKRLCKGKNGRFLLLPHGCPFYGTGGAVQYGQKRKGAGRVYCKFCGGANVKMGRDCPWCGRYIPNFVPENCLVPVSSLPALAEQKKYPTAREYRKLDRQPVKAVLLDWNVLPPRGSSLASGMLGYMLLGELGAFIGIYRHSKKRTKILLTFQVTYASGRVAKETVDLESARLEKLKKVLVE